MNGRLRSAEPELLDRPGIPFVDLARNLRELDVINTLLVGHRITLKGLRKLLGKNTHTPVHIAEIGCGGGDNLRVIHRYLLAQGCPHRLTGIDLKPECIEYAQAHSGIGPGAVEWICSPYETVCFPETAQPDIIFCSLFCHHFPDAELVSQLHWLQANSRLGFFINDLQRHPVAYYSIRQLTRLFSRSYLVKNDAPLSVLRGFRKAEWQRLFRTAGLPSPEITWQWAFRHLVVFRNR